MVEPLTAFVASIGGKPLRLGTLGLPENSRHAPARYQVLRGSIRGMRAARERETPSGRSHAGSVRWVLKRGGRAPSRFGGRPEVRHDNNVDAYISTPPGSYQITHFGDASRTSPVVQ
jgi:hypothetical protein